MDLNKVQIIGRVSSDVEIKKISNDSQVVNLSVATNRTWKEGNNKKDQATFHSIAIWGKLADIANTYLKKGSKVYIEGHLHTNQWENEKGEKKYRTEIICENIIMLDSKKEDSNDETL